MKKMVHLIIGTSILALNVAAVAVISIGIFAYVLITKSTRPTKIGVLK